MRNPDHECVPCGLPLDPEGRVENLSMEGIFGRWGRGVAKPQNSNRHSSPPSPSPGLASITQDQLRGARSDANMPIGILKMGVVNDMGCVRRGGIRPGCGELAMRDPIVGCASEGNARTPECRLN